MKKELVVYLIITAIVIAALGLLFFYQNKQTAVTTDDKTIFYYGDGCPHCLNVEKFFAENKITDKIKFEQKEVFKDQTNATEMTNYAKNCGLDVNNIGVPFLWTGSSCISGDVPIIQYFKDKTNIN